MVSGYSSVFLAAFASVTLSILASGVLVSKMEKVVLVCMGENKRIVPFSTPAGSESQLQTASSATVADTEALAAAIRVAFKDVLQPGQEFFLQLKNEEWGGVFVDLLGGPIPDRSVVRAVLKPVTEVS